LNRNIKAIYKYHHITSTFESIIFNPKRKDEPLVVATKIPRAEEETFKRVCFFYLFVVFLASLKRESDALFFSPFISWYINTARVLG